LDFLQSIILGIIQGITEILPISSTAHLVLLPWLMKWTDPGLAHNIALHIGTLLAIIIYFRRDWLDIGREFFLGIADRSYDAHPKGKLALYIIVATIPGAIAGLALESYARTIFRSPLVIVAALSVFGLILFLADKHTRKSKSIDEMNFMDALIIGVFQAIAIIPGVSRSGITITAGLFMSYQREEAARFSFLMAAPIIAGAGIFELRHFELSTLVSPEFLTGIATSTIFCFLSIRFLLSYVRNNNYTVFVAYRLVLAAVVLALYLARG